MLVDDLMDRYEAVQLVDQDSKLELEFLGQQPIVKLNGNNYNVTDAAFETLLNFLRIPTKYIQRCLEEGASKLAVESIDFWMSQKSKFSLLIESGEITQIFDGKRLYVPCITVNDLIVELIPHVTVVDYTLNSDLMHAVYVSEDTTDYGNGLQLSVGVRALYSDCFKVTPRFDGILYNRDTKAMYCWPVQGRKFRSASTTLSQVLDQVQDFIYLAQDQMKEQLVPKLKLFLDQANEPKDCEAFVTRLVSDLRFNKKQQQELLDQLADSCMPPAEIVQALSSYTVKSAGAGYISLLDAREIQVALSSYLVTGTFK